MGKWNSSRFRQTAGVAVLAALTLMTISCESLRQEYIRQDKFTRIAAIEDIRTDDTVLVSKELTTDPDAEMRAKEALAIGRIGTEFYRPYLKAQLSDPDPIAAEAKFFAAGLLADSAFFGPIFILAQQDSPAREAAVEALGRIGDSSRADQLRPFLEDADTLVAYQAMLAIGRLKGWQLAGKMAEIGLNTPNRKVKFGALYSLARGKRPEGHGLFLSVLFDSDPEFRMQGYLGLGRSADSASIDLIASGITDADNRVIAAAMMGLDNLGSLGTERIGVKLPELTDEKLVELGLQLIGNHPYPNAFPLVQKIFRDDSRENIRAAAAKAMLQIAGVNALLTIDEILTHPTTWEKAKIAEGLAGIDPKATVKRLRLLLFDPAPIVRSTALESACKADSLSAEQHLHSALSDTDFVVVATAVTLAADRKLVGMKHDIAALYLSQRGRIDADLKRTIIESWDNFPNDPASDSIVIACLKEGCNDEWCLIRRIAARILFDKYKIDLRGTTGIFASNIEKGNFRELFWKYKTNPVAHIETNRGAITIELLYDQAPKTVNNFIALAKKGFYNNRIFHRVVPNFVIQDGCPRGDGWGGPGYTIRCEYNRVPYATGTVGMALSGKDTGGSQYFITLSPQPHLDAHYTAFGRVIAGMEVAQQMVRGDGIKTVTIEEKGNER